MARYPWTLGLAAAGLMLAINAVRLSIDPARSLEPEFAAITGAMIVWAGLFGWSIGKRTAARIHDDAVLKSGSSTALGSGMPAVDINAVQRAELASAARPDGRGKES